MPEERRNRRDRQRNKDRNKERDIDERKIILAKNDDHRPSGSSRQESSSSQPKILLKPKEPDTSRPATLSTKEFTPKEKSVEAPDTVNTVTPEPVHVQQETVPMPEALPLITNELVLNTESLFTYMQEWNNDYLVVAFVGPQNSGKSTFANIMLNKTCSLETLQNLDGIKFPVRRKKHKLRLSPVTEGMDIFITEDRLIILDCAPLLANISYKDYILSELDDLKLLSVLLNICNLVVVVQENYINPNVVRMLHNAEMMRNIGDDSCAKIMFVQNKTELRDLEPDTVYKMKSLYKTTFQTCNLSCYMLRSENGDEEKRVENVNYIAFPDYNDLDVKKTVDNTIMKHCIDNFRQNVMLTKRFETSYTQSVQFNEKMWLQSVAKAWDSLGSNYFFKKYANLKEKFNLLNHVSISDGVKYDKNVYYPDD